MALLVRPMLDRQRELLMMRSGFAAPDVRPQKPRNSYLTNVLTTNSRYWQSYLENPEHQCLVPLTGQAKTALHLDMVCARRNATANVLCRHLAKMGSDRGTKTFPDNWQAFGVLLPDKRC